MGSQRNILTSEEKTPTRDNKWLKNRWWEKRDREYKGNRPLKFGVHDTSWMPKEGISGLHCLIRKYIYIKKLLIGRELPLSGKN